MSEPFADWDAVVAFACSLPNVEMAPFYGALCPKVNGKAFVAPSRAPDSFCLYVAKAEKPMLLETDPDTFWVTGHFLTYPAVLARFGTPARERIELYVRRAWWDRATPAGRVLFGERP
jgi:hypothetical protein